MQPSNAIAPTPFACSQAPYQARKAYGGTNALRQENQAMHPVRTSSEC